MVSFLFLSSFGNCFLLLSNIGKLVLTFNFFIMNENQDVLKLIEDAERFCEVYLHYSDKTLHVYRTCWNKICELMDLYGIDHIGSDTEAILLRKIGYKKNGSHTCSKEYFLQRSVRMLVAFAETQSIPATIERNEHVFNNILKPYLVDFLQYLTLKLRRNKITVDAYRKSLESFLEHLTKNESLTRMEDLNIAMVLRFIQKVTPSSGFRPILIIGHLRGFLAFLHMIGITEIDISAQIPRAKRIQPEKLPSTYSIDEIKKAILSIDRTSAIGKRDYAIFLLMARLGLRTSDIINLKFSNIRWSENQIHIYQYKTGIPVNLPLLADVGNAIIDYLKFGRPVVKGVDYIFLSQRASVQISRMCVYMIVKNAFLNAGISVKDRHHGGHSLRHSLSYHMLKCNTPMTIITQVLGHAEQKTAQYYMKIDINSLRQCVLSVPDVDKKFYLTMEREQYVFF